MNNENENTIVDLETTQDVVDFLSRFDAPRGSLAIACTDDRGERVRALVNTIGDVTIDQGSSI